MRTTEYPVDNRIRVYLRTFDHIWKMENAALNATILLLILSPPYTASSGIDTALIP